MRFVASGPLLVRIVMWSRASQVIAHQPQGLRAPAGRVWRSASATRGSLLALPAACAEARRGSWELKGPNRLANLLSKLESLRRLALALSPAFEALTGVPVPHGFLDAPRRYAVAGGSQCFVDTWSAEL